MKPFRSHAGFGILELVIVGALTALMSLMMNRLLATSFAGAKAVQAKTDMESLATLTKIILENETLCHLNLINSRAVPSSAFFYPDGLVNGTDALNAVIQYNPLALPTDPVTVIAKVGVESTTLRITELKLMEVDKGARTPYGTTGERYVVKLRITAIKVGPGYAGGGTAGAFRAGTLVEEIPLWVATDISSHQIIACGAAGGSAYLPELISAPLRFEFVKDTNPGACDTGPKFECYCGGLETVHRANGSNEEGSPYKHAPNDPAGNAAGSPERPRKWAATVTCRDGYVLGAVGAKCAEVSGKLENIVLHSTKSATVSCCSYTPDSNDDGDTIHKTTGKGSEATAVCYKH